MPCLRLPTQDTDADTFANGKTNINPNTGCLVLSNLPLALHAAIANAHPNSLARPNANCHSLVLSNLPLALSATHPDSHPNRFTRQLPY